MVAASAACYFSSTSASSSSSFSSFSSSSPFSPTFSYSFSSSAASPPFIRSDLGHQRRCPFIPPSIHANARLLIQAAFPSPITYKPCNFRQMPIPIPNYPLYNCFCSKRIHHLKNGGCYLRQQLYTYLANLSIIGSVRNSNSHPDLLLTHPTTPIFLLTPVLPNNNIGFSLSEPLQIYQNS